ncbi:MAG: DUF4405 domain-containing protein [Chlorobiaceae bacterium]|nr:DUF4405 domain-containing protein [Chlorobiaceae bacterium]
MKASIKSWATPLASGAFTISAVTGLLLFFEIEIGMVEDVHKWLSWLLVGGVLLHVISNWKPFTAYFSKKPALALISTALLVTIASMLPLFGEKEEGENEKAGEIATGALETSSLSTVALVIKTTPELLVEKLGKSGIIVKDPALTIKEIAQNNGKNEKELLGSLLAQPQGSQEKNGDRD